MEYQPSWKYRRRVIFGSLIFCTFIILISTLYSMAAPFFNIEVEVDFFQTLLWGSFTLMASVIGSYVFGATWDDKNIISSIKGNNQ